MNLQSRYQQCITPEIYRPTVSTPTKPPAPPALHQNIKAMSEQLYAYAMSANMMLPMVQLHMQAMMSQLLHNPEQQSEDQCSQFGREISNSLRKLPPWLQEKTKTEILGMVNFALDNIQADDKNTSRPSLL